MAGGQQARDPIHGRSEVIAPAFVGLTRMDRHSYAQAADRAPVFLGDAALRFDRRARGIQRIGECGAKGIADGFENVTAICGNTNLQDGIVRAQGRLHRLAVRLPPRRTALDIRKEERDGPGGMSLRSHPGLARRLLPTSPSAIARFPRSVHWSSQHRTAPVRPIRTNLRRRPRPPARRKSARAPDRHCGPCRTRLEGALGLERCASGMK